MPEIRFVSGFASGTDWQFDLREMAEIKGIAELPPIRARTTMGSEGSDDFCVTEWEDHLGRKYQHWGIRTIGKVYGIPIQTVSGYSMPSGAINL